MPLLWRDEFSVGVKIMDEEHKQLIHLINLFEEATSGEGETRQKALRAALDGVDDYVRTHFTVEEELMRIYDVPGREAHIKIHRAFQEQVARIRKDFHEGEMLIIKPIIGLLQHWLTDHIQKIDKHLAQELNQRGLN